MRRPHQKHRGCPAKIHEEVVMKVLDVPPPSAGSVAAAFESARELAFSLAESDGELFEPVLIACIDRSAGKASPVLGRCSGQDGWHDYGISHDGRRYHCESFPKGSVSHGSRECLLPLFQRPFIRMGWLTGMHKTGTASRNQKSHYYCNGRRRT